MSLGRTFSKLTPLHLLVTVGVGIASGQYIFGEPLRQHWANLDAEGHKNFKQEQPKLP